MPQLIVQLRRLRPSLVIPGSILALQIAAGTTLALTLPQSHPTDLHGIVRCSSGARVQGIWVEGFSGGSQFADLSAADTASTIRYRYRLPYGGKYQLRVGCGGSGGDWKVTAYSTYVDGPEHSFTCHDERGQPNYGKCLGEPR